MPLLRKRTLLLTISLVEGDTIRATVIPEKASDTEDNVLTTPLAITGTAEELDRDLPQQLVEFIGAHLQLQTTLASAKAEMEAAAKAAREEARKKTSKRRSWKSCRQSGRIEVRRSTTHSASYVQDGIGVGRVLFQQIDRLFRRHDDQFNFPTLGFDLHLLHYRQGTGAGADYEAMALPRYPFLQR
jgi:PRTRC genetic system protein E